MAEAVRAATREVVLVANAREATSWLPDTRVVRDRETPRGSLVGLHTALTAGDDDDVLLVAWDMPFLAPELLQFIASRLIAPIHAAVPELPSGLEPFCAAYSVRCLPIVERRLGEGDLRMTSFIDALPVVRRISSSEIARFGDPARLFFNVNTPEDLAAAERMARGD